VFTQSPFAVLLHGQVFNAHGRFLLAAHDALCLLLPRPAATCCSSAFLSLASVTTYQIERRYAQGLCEDDEEAFVKMISHAWFGFYRRDEGVDSCGFEHVFVGELDDGHVKGLHNWLQTMVEESRGDLDYLGFVLPRRHNQREADDDDLEGPRRVVSIQLGWEVRSSLSVCFSLCHGISEEEKKSQHAVALHP
jgi:hypothetical protein